MNLRSNPSRRPAGGAEDGRACPRLATRAFRSAPGGTLATVALLGTVFGAAANATDDRPEGAAGPETVAGNDGGVNAVEASGILPRLDALLDSLEARIEDIRGQAEQMLDHADAATDDEGRIRFEEMYGKLAAAAEKLEEEHDRLRSMRDEIAAAGGEQRP